MKIRNIFLPLLCITFISCGEDRRTEYAERTALDRWIEAEMRDKYFWFEDMPEKKSLNFFQDPETFFGNLLSSEDGTGSQKFSRIVAKDGSEAETRSTTSVSYGFQYTLYQNGKIYYARVLYALNNSPASDATLERGDWIFEINGDSITDNNIEMLTSGSGMTLSTGYLDAESNPEITDTKSLSAPRYVEENPIYYYNTYERGNKKIGYLVYNSFTSGKDEDNSSDITYLNELSNLSNDFKAAGINEFILDLRYNPGGELNRPVPLICSMLAPASIMGEEMGYTVFNTKNQDKNEAYYFSTDHLRGGSNLDMQRVFVLTTTNTASASEAVINFLNPYMDVIIVGGTTVGKNVGSQKIEDDKYLWILHPIVCELYNSNDESEYTSGFPAKYAITESQYSVLLPFGNPNEILLSTALSVIDGTYNPDTESRSISQQRLIQASSSLDRKSLPGVIIKP